MLVQSAVYSSTFQNVDSGTESLAQHLPEKRWNLHSYGGTLARARSPSLSSSSLSLSLFLSLSLSLSLCKAALCRKQLELSIGRIA